MNLRGCGGMVDAHGLGPCAVRLGGSSPFIRTNIMLNPDQIEELQVLHYGGRVIEEIHQATFAGVPKNPDGSIADPLNLRRDFGSGGGLISQFDAVVRLALTRSRIAEIRAELTQLGIEPRESNVEQLPKL